MRELVRKRRIVMIEAGKQVRRRHGDAVGSRLVVGLIPLMTEHCRERSKEGVELLLAAFGLDEIKRCGRVEALRKILDLIGVEDRIGLQDAAGFLAGLPGIGGLDLLGIALVEDRDGGFFTLAHLRAKFLVG